MKDLSHIKLFLLDMDGTVTLGDRLLPGAAEAISWIRQSGRRLCFLTNNSSKSGKEYLEKLNRLGISVKEEEIFTSGQATAFLLRDHYAGKRVYLVGTDRLKEEFLDAGIPLTEEDAEIVVLGYDTTLTYAKLVKLTGFLNRGAVFIATHPDVNCPAPESYVPDVGSFLKMIEASTGRMPQLICGKPDPLMGELIAKRFQVSAEETAMVGDRLYTDMRFAIQCGFTGVLVLSGETDEKMLAESGMRPDLVISGISELFGSDGSGLYK